jgi:preprotein translocase subunit SecE
VTGRSKVVAKKTKTESETQSTESGFNVATFFDDTKEELGKVVWPSRQQLISESAAVLLMVILSATLIYLVDGLFVWVSKQVF